MIAVNRLLADAPDPVDVMADDLPPLPDSTSPPSSRPAPSPAVSDRAARGILLWCARRLAGREGLYRGRIRVDIHKGRGEETVTVRPGRGCDGRTDPEFARAAASAVVPAADLLRTYLSADCRTILRAVARLQPCKANDVFDAVRANRISNTAFWVYWRDLQVRGLVVDAEPTGFGLGNDWIRDLIG